jgi:hypothetical protein
MFFFSILFYDVTNEEDRMLLVSYGGDPIPIYECVVVECETLE